MARCQIGGRGAVEQHSFQTARLEQWCVHDTNNIEDGRLILMQQATHSPHRTQHPPQTPTPLKQPPQTVNPHRTQTQHQPLPAALARAELRRRRHRGISQAARAQQQAHPPLPTTPSAKPAESRWSFQPQRPQHNTIRLVTL